MKSLFAFIFWAVVFFLVFSVCGWSLNPGHWGGFWRGLWIFITFIAGVYYIHVYSEEGD
jgi:hypothetical protein